MYLRFLAVFWCFFASCAVAGPMISAGDNALRHDIQRLADYGVITGTVSTWPLEWGAIMADVRRFESDARVPADVLDAIARLELRAAWETREQEPIFRASVSASEKSTAIRSFQFTPRNEADVSAGVSWTGDRVSIELSGTATGNAADNEEFHADGSHVAVAIGNFSIAASTLDRWWGPAWDGSLVLSNNARPVPALTLDRRHQDPFRTKWLSWLGPWDFSVIWGRLESFRDVPEARFVGARFAFRPHASIEIGLSRTAQWCGVGRPCGLDTFWDLLLGRDNVGSDNVTAGNEPGNQTAALDFRWSATRLGAPVAVYGQFMAEDEAGGFPSRYLAQLGIDGHAYLFERWSARWFAEASATSCDAVKSVELFNCAYNHGVYTSGYRYRGRPIGHGADNDARLLSAGVILVDRSETQWQALMRYGVLNRGGPPDANNSLTATRQDLRSVDLAHSRSFRFGIIDVGVGFEQRDDAATGTSSEDVRAFLQWRSSY